MEVEMDFTGLTDEEIAHKLQMQFLEESGQSNENYLTILSNYENTQKDADYALQLQTDMSMYDLQPQIIAPFVAPTPPVPVVSTTTATTTTATTATATSTEKTTDASTEKMIDDEDEELQCLICYEVPDEYVVLPMCKMPHIYCFGCAEKMLENGPQKNVYHRHHQNATKQSIKCPLCSSVSQLPSRGLVAFRKRTKKRVVNITQGVCETHNGPLLLYFCYDCLQPVCINCINGQHGRHNYTSLDSAFDSCKKEVGNQINQLFDEQKKVTTHQATLEGMEETINQKTAVRLSELKKQMEDLRKELDRQEAAFENAIVQMQKRKIASIASDKKYATERLERVNRGLKIASQALNYNTQPLHFFQVLAENEEDLASLVNSQENNPMVAHNNYDLPTLPFADLQHRVSSLRYVDRKNPIADEYHSYSYTDEDEGDSDNDEEGYYS